MQSIGPQLSPFTTSAASPHIFDSLGRVTILHGTNFVNKAFPWYPEALLNPSNINDLKKSGMNTVRLGFMWSGAEPVEGQYNMSYFTIMGDIVDRLASNGIYTIIDVHQDVLSSKFCLYDGAPLWLVDKAEDPNRSFPWPLKWDGINPCPYERGWGSNYLTEATGKAFDGLYTNHGGMRDSFVNFWKHTANYFKDKQIIGYEILNEPWAGDIYRQPDLLIPGHAGRKNLLPFYDIVSSAIRASDPNNLILYEPVTWGMIFNGTVIGSGFDRVPGGAEFATSSVYSFHYYCWWLDTSSEISQKTCDEAFGPKVFNQVGRELHQLGGSALLTEWGQGCADQLFSIDLDKPSTYAECLAIMDLADKHFLGWTDWYFGGKLGNYDWVPFSVSSPAWNVFTRPYARSIAGIPKETHFDFSTKSFHLCYFTEPKLNLLSTEVFVHFEMTYPQGYEIIISHNIELIAEDEEAHVVKVRATRSAEDSSRGPAPPSLACVDIVAKV